ncbi:MAG: PEP-CTERM sorting domain-containing protein, partial [Akkermansia sp.]|nr:PEP-CTERM sorting domain-containing protein [Akkermansia sp.]
NTIYLGDSTNVGATGGSIHFGNDDDSTPRNTTTLSGAIYLIENATLKARGTNTINITGTVTDKNVPGSTDADGGYKLTLAGKGYNFTETSNVNVTTLEFAAAQTIHNTVNVTTSATFKNGFSADNLIMNVGNEITSEKAISGLTSLTVLGNGKATLAADLNLTSLSTLELDATLNISGNELTLGNAITFSGGKLEALQEIDDLATIFEGVSVFNGVARSAETVIFDASKYFANLPTENQYVLSYTNGNVAIKLIPEPTTATLSLLALAGLAARRRRR